MPRRPVLLLLGSLSMLGVVVSGPATASKASCRLVVDAAHDTTLGGAQKAVPTEEPALDVVSADIAVDARWVTTAVRVRQLFSPESSTVLPNSGRWSLFFRVGEAAFVVHARTGQGGEMAGVSQVYGLDPTTYSWVEAPITAHPRVTLDRRRSEVRVSVPRADFESHGGVPLRTKLTDIGVVTWHENTVTPFGKPGGEYDLADEAGGKASYVTGTASCVKPGS